MGLYIKEKIITISTTAKNFCFDLPKDIGNN